MPLLLLIVLLLILFGGGFSCGGPIGNCGIGLGGLLLLLLVLYLLGALPVGHWR